MLIAELKQKDEILSLADGKTLIICCEGCSEVNLLATEAAEVVNELLVCGTALGVIRTDYICNPEHLLLQLEKYADTIDHAESLLVFSCGVGMQTVAAYFPKKRVYTACDTYPLPGHQGVTPLEFDCSGCGNCHLNETGGICPITSCAKGLTSGQCGGSRGGKCEVDSDMECGWSRINRALGIDPGL